MPAAAPALLLLSLTLAPPAPLTGGKAGCRPSGGCVGDAVAGADAAAAAVLARWERAAAGRVPASRADRAAARHARPEAPDELLALAAALHGPVKAADLLARYRWTADRTADGTVRLHAAPADPLARVFTPRLTVALGADGAPRSITAADPHGPPQTLALAPPAAAPRARNAALDTVIRGQSPAAAGFSGGRPIRTALFTRPAGARPAWQFERSGAATPDPPPRQPLTAPRPR